MGAKTLFRRPFSAGGHATFVDGREGIGPAFLTRPTVVATFPQGNAFDCMPGGGRRTLMPIIVCRPAAERCGKRRNRNSEIHCAIVAAHLSCAPSRHGCSIADINVPRSAANGAIGLCGEWVRHERFIADVNVLKPVSVRRWFTETELTRTPPCGCKRVEKGSGRQGIPEPLLF
jgi:hypothetical protein